MTSKPLPLPEEFPKISVGDRSKAQVADIDMHLEIDCDLNRVGSFVRYVDDRLNLQNRLSASDRLRICGALQEALFNAIYHGSLELGSELRETNDALFHEMVKLRSNQLPYATRKVAVHFVSTVSYVKVVIRDEGPGFDVKNVPDPTEGDNLFKVYGRGLLLIRSFMDTISHNALGNEITMIKRLHPADESDSNSSLNASADLETTSTATNSPERLPSKTDSLWTLDDGRR